MKQQFPNLLIPPLPKANKNLLDKVLIKRKLRFQRFLQTLARVEEIKATSAYLFFLYLPSSESWQNCVKKEEKVKYPGTNLKALITESGTVGVQPFEETAFFVNKM